MKQTSKTTNLDQTGVGGIKEDRARRRKDYWLKAQGELTQGSRVKYLSKREERRGIQGNKGKTREAKLREVR